MAKDPNLNSASILLGSLKKESMSSPVITQPTEQPVAVQPTVQPVATQPTVQPMQTEPLPVHELKNRIMREGDDFVVRVVEKRRKKKNFLFPETLEEKFAQEAADLNVSQNELIIQILQQRYK